MKDATKGATIFSLVLGILGIAIFGYRYDWPLISRITSKLAVDESSKPTDSQSLKAAETTVTTRLSGKYSPDQIRAALLGKTKEEVIALIGQPDENRDGQAWEFDLFNILPGEGNLVGPSHFRNLPRNFFVYDTLTDIYFKKIVMSFKHNKVSSMYLFGNARAICPPPSVAPLPPGCLPPDPPLEPYSNR